VVAVGNNPIAAIPLVVVSVIIAFTYTLLFFLLE